MKKIILILLVCIAVQGMAQEVPGKEENIPFLVTFGAQADKSYGDDDYCQVFFFKIPKEIKTPIYIKVFDPDVGGQHDEGINGFNTKTKFSIYGGKGAFTDKDATGVDPKGNFKSGALLHTKTFSVSTTYDNKWYSFGPINPAEGEYIPSMNAYILKVICEGVSGDDGNLYRYFLSSSQSKNIAVSGGNAFTYEYTVRLHDKGSEVSHIYPYIDNNVVSLMQFNFDWDSDGAIKLYSRSKLGEKGVVSGDGVWKKSKHPITEKEKNNCIDMRFEKNSSAPVKNNNVVFYVTNQYGEFLPFYAVPIGSYSPDGSGKISVKPK